MFSKIDKSNIYDDLLQKGCKFIFIYCLSFVRDELKNYKKQN